MQVLVVHADWFTQARDIDSDALAVGALLGGGQNVHPVVPTTRYDDITPW